MTLSSSSPRNSPHKILLIAGLNNNDEALSALANEFRVRGFECHILNLPGQGEDRSETDSFERAERVFADKISTLKLDHYGVIAFSTGALYYNLWLSQHPLQKPLFQILLAPAFEIRNGKTLSCIFSNLPSRLSIKSLAPKKFRRYHWMRVSEYRQLFRLQEKFHLLKYPFQSPIKIYVDERDELVDARKLKEKYTPDVTLLRRPVGKLVPGMFHAIFHPDFWKEDGWKSFIHELAEFSTSAGGSKK